jgi:IS30 family transposase
VPTESRFTSRRKERILELLAAGASRGAAARAAGVHPSTLCRWVQRGRTASPGTAWARFLKDVQAAERTHEPQALRDQRAEYEGWDRDPFAALAYVLATDEWAADPARALAAVLDTDS